MNAILASGYIRRINELGLATETGINSDEYLAKLRAGTLVLASTGPVDKLPDFIETMPVTAMDIFLPELKDWHIKYPDTVTRLGLNHNGLTEFPKYLPPNLEVLDLRSNEICEFPDMSGMKALMCICIRNNPGLQNIHIDLPDHLVERSNGVWAEPNYRIKWI